jgi:PPM family protein phosphatase
MSLALRYAVRSDRGLVRGNNEDSVYAGPRLLAIADGMGGHAAGEVASKLVIAAMEHLDEDRSLDDLLAALREAVMTANRGIFDSVRRDSALEGMGTTLTALRFTGTHVGLVHVGDSRAYLLRNNQLSQITHDDTYVQSLVDSGRLTPEEASHHPRKSVILRALTGTDVDPDVSIREVRPGDRYLLCTDGLSDVVSAATLFETLATGDPQECADRLVDLALRGGGPDNITCIVADVLDTGSGDHGDDMPVIAGAFVDAADSSAKRPPDDGDSPAERAALMTESSIPPDATPTHADHRLRRWRSLIFAVVVAAVVFGGLTAAYAWTQTQYFVGPDGSEVAIFRGVKTEFGPLKFFNVAKNTDLKLGDLKPAARSQVMNGITANDEADAEQIVQNLRGEQLPACPPIAAPSGSDSASPSTSPSTSPTHASSKPPAKSQARSTAPGRRSTAANGPRSDAPTTSATPTSPALSPSTPASTPTPGVECK